MKKLFIILLLFTLISCGVSIENPVQSTGRITKVIKTDSITYIQVQFYGTENHKSWTYDSWFEGSDTCRVDQIVNLK